MSRILLVVGICLAFVACSRAPEAPEAGGAANVRRISGRVVERLDGAPYSFLRVQREEGEVWVAVPISAVPVGEVVEVENGVSLRNHEARSIGKRFESIVFGTVRQR